MLVFVSVIAVLLSGFARSLLLDAAVEGARYGAMADQNSAAGCQRALTQLEQTFGQGWSFGSVCSSTLVAGVATEVVELSIGPPAIGFLPSGTIITEEAHAQREF